MVAWYENAVVYTLDVRTFQDADGDGTGDFDGLAARLPYLSSLGVTALWLLPFLPTPLRDGGYDVTDYYDVDERVGGMAAFVRFARRAASAGLRLIVDLPLNHTSVEHPWFQSARTDRSSPWRDFYLWVDEPPADSPKQVVAHKDEDGPWTFDDEAGQYYLHRFYSDEPDLNHANPAVRKEVLRILEFWLDLGASGIRIDAAPYIAKKSAADPHAGTPHPFLAEMHERVRSVRPDAMLLGEVDVKPAELSSYFGDGTEMQVLLDFLMNNYFFLALAREEAEPLVKALGVLPRRPSGGQWANWVRNHDELDLERLSSEERADVMAAFAPDEDMRIYGRGIRRRLAPMLDGDQRRIELAYSLLFALPGSPIIRYGDEIGMGDDLTLPERNAVRTPMQWSPEPNGGFSTADPKDLIMPTVAGGQYGYETTTVMSQQLDRTSLLARMHLFVTVRRQHPEMGEQEPEILETGDPAVLGFAYPRSGDVTVVLHNLSGSARTLRLDGFSAHRFVSDILADAPYDSVDDEKWETELRPYGYRWLKACRTGPEGGGSADAAMVALRDRPH